MELYFRHFRFNDHFSLIYRAVLIPVALADIRLIGGSLGNKAVADVQHVVIY